MSLKKVSITSSEASYLVLCPLSFVLCFFWRVCGVTMEYSADGQRAKNQELSTKNKNQRPKTQDLFISQGFHRVELRGAARRDVAGQHSNQEYQSRDNSESCCICRRHAEQHALQQARGRKRTSQPQRYPNQRQCGAVPYNQSQHIDCSCSQSHANTHLVLALCD